jgi:CubicO group peptidase (beta-lactamase class C family)
MHSWKLSLILLILVSATCALPTKQGTTIAVQEPDEWEQYVRRKRLESGVPALAIAAAKQDEVLFAAVSGVRTVNADTLAEVGDKFHIGSVTKPITATMIARLVEDGRIRWETTPVDVWPDEAHAFAPHLRRITVEQLLSHRAGMPAFETDEENATFEQRRGESPREERARFARWLLAREASFPIGEHVYSNAGYGLVAAMAEAVTGLNWEQLVEREVFAALEIRSCGFGWPASSGDQPSGHRMVEGLLQPHDLSDGYQLRAAIAPAGDIYCSIEDLVRFGQVHLQGLQMETGYLGQATFQKMHDAPHGEYALGWNVRSFGSHHLGSAGTFDANLIIFRDVDLVTAVATNTSGSITSEKFSEIASHLYRRLGTPKPSSSTVKKEEHAQ